MIKDSQSVNVSDATSVRAAYPLEEGFVNQRSQITDVDENTNCDEAMSPRPSVPKDSGLKRHIIIDTLGLVLVVLVHAANIANVTDGSENGCSRSFFKCESLSGTR